MLEAEGVGRDQYGVVHWMTEATKPWHPRFAQCNPKIKCGTSTKMVRMVCPVCFPAAAELIGDPIKHSKDYSWLIDAHFKRKKS